jgi:hypothetical protein
MIDPMRIPDLVAEFADAVSRQTDCIRAGDARTGNANAKRYIAAFNELRAIGDAGRDALSSLFEHERSDVRVMAAAFLLRHKTPESLAILRAEAESTGISAFGASQAIDRWNEGDWNLDPE